MIKLIDETNEVICIEIDNDLKMDVDIQITLFQKEDGNYGAEYELAEYHNVLFKGKQVDSSYKKWDEWVTNYNNLMQVDLEGDIFKYLNAYFAKYEQEPLLLANEYNIKL
jgi:hypothetical protein